MKRALIGSGATSLALFAAGTYLLRRMLRSYTVDALERMRVGR